MSKPLTASWQDVWLLDGVRTPFVDYNGGLAQISPIDLGIKAAREVFARSGASPDDVGTVITGNMAQASFDAYLLPRHIGLYSGVPIETPAHMVQRVCGTGIEVLMQAADTDLAQGRRSRALRRHRIDEPQSDRRLHAPQRLPHGAGRVQGLPLGSPDGPLRQCHDGRHRGEPRAAIPDHARRGGRLRGALASTAPCKAKECGFLAGEIAPVKTEEFSREGYNARGIKLSRETKELDHDTHIRPSTVEALAKIRPAFGGVQTGGNSSAIVDGAAAALAASADYVKSSGKAPLGRLVAGAAAGVPPEIMGIGPVPAIQAVVERAGLKLSDIDRFEINEAFGAQVMACARALDLDEDKLNVNGGAIAIGHPLGATGVRLSVTLARELKRAGLRYGIASACIGGGQGIALLIENPDARQDGRTDMDIKGHAAIVTGGGSGLGAATAALLAEAGAKVALLDVNMDAAQCACAEDRRHRGQMRRRRLRRAPRPPSRRRTRRTAPARILINCAGIGIAKRIVGRDGPKPLADYERVIRINLIGSFNTLRLFAADLSKADPLDAGERGVAINTASVAAFDGQIGQAAYSSSKGGIVALTLPAARELAQFGIRVCAIAPGIFLTPMLLGLSEEVQKSLAAAVPFPQLLGKPEEYASLARHIVENRYLNGEVIRLDGALRMAPK